MQWSLLSIILTYFLVGLQSNLMFAATIPSRDAHTLVVGGEYATPGEFPWMAQILPVSGLEAFCGGSLITTDSVLTARHCVLRDVTNINTGRNKNSIRVALGGHDQQNPDANVKYFRVKGIYLHEDADIAVLKLSSRAILTDRVKTIPMADSKPGWNRKLTVAGWGTTGLNQPVSDILKKATTLRSPLCSLPQYRICVGWAAPDNDCACPGNVCHGDSGGPLMLRKEAPPHGYKLTGVTSGRNLEDPAPACAHGASAVFISVSYFKQWIQEVIAFSGQEEIMSGYGVFDGRCEDGIDLGSWSVSKLQCAHNCMQRPDCRAAVMNPEGTQCTLKSACDKRGCYEGWKSYIKYNVALGKVTSQSSVYDNALASRAVDGNTDPQWDGGSCTHTHKAPRNWWKVDLGAQHQIFSVIIYNRGSCCSDRLNNFKVIVQKDDVFDEDEDEYDGPNYDPGQVCASCSGGRCFTDLKAKMVCKAEGRLVFILIEQKDSYLTLCEVEVFGFKAGYRRSPQKGPCT